MDPPCRRGTLVKQIIEPHRQLAVRRGIHNRTSRAVAEKASGASGPAVSWINAHRARRGASLARPHRAVQAISVIPPGSAAWAPVSDRNLNNRRSVRLRGAARGTSGGRTAGAPGGGGPGRHRPGPRSLRQQKTARSNDVSARASEVPPNVSTVTESPDGKPLPVSVEPADEVSASA